MCAEIIFPLNLSEVCFTFNIFPPAISCHLIKVCMIIISNKTENNFVCDKTPIIGSIKFPSGLISVVFLPSAFLSRLLYHTPFKLWKETSYLESYWATSCTSTWHPLTCHNYPVEPLSVVGNLRSEGEEVTRFEKEDHVWSNLHGTWLWKHQTLVLNVLVKWHLYQVDIPKILLPIPVLRC